MVTKITVSTAMRARDVSRPREDQLAEATAREEAAARQGAPAPGERATAGPGLGGGAKTPGAQPAQPAQDRAAQPAGPGASRRRRRRSR